MVSTYACVPASRADDGEAAGQTIDHAHLHIIPRYSDDVPDPRGGIRLVIPDRARYWSE
jgi:diadenosine tetraphosphate (Ap4A) HIT family hydrolase